MRGIGTHINSTTYYCAYVYRRYLAPGTRYRYDTVYLMVLVALTKQFGSKYLIPPTVLHTDEGVPAVVVCTSATNNLMYQDIGRQQVSMIGHGQAGLFFRHFTTAIR